MEEIVDTVPYLSLAKVEGCGSKKFAERRHPTIRLFQSYQHRSTLLHDTTPRHSFQCLRGALRNLLLAYLSVFALFSANFCAHRVRTKSLHIF